ncbi:HAD family hydrolase [Oceanidesulfovibrio indonesiensis]|nr:HAD family hydrolase [Oceanidesulfovibrio indonesiensis]
MRLTLRNREGHGNTFHHPRPIKGLIFDCDGVLLDTMESNRVYYNMILEKLGLEPMTPEQLAYVHSRTARQSVEYIVPQYLHHRIPDVLQQVDYMRDILPHLRAMDGLLPALRWCQTAGLKMAVATNRSTTMDRVISMFGLQRYFFPVMTALKKRPKPHPDQLTHILRVWGAHPEEVAFVGDTEVDQATARLAGVPFWAFGDESLLADAHVRDYRHLVNSLARILQLPVGCQEL